MLKNNLGYIFECKKDKKGNVGIKESFNFSSRENIQRFSAIFSIDMSGTILCPSFHDKALGLTSLRSIVHNETFEQDMEKFIRSNRATYSLSTATYLICSIEAKINKLTGEWVDGEVKVNFYVPKGSSSLGKLMNNQSEEWGIVCDIASPAGKLNTFHVSEGVLNGYAQMVLNQLKPIVLSNKKAYLSGRVARY